jgi:hypothetical protein
LEFELNGTKCVRYAVNPKTAGDKCRLIRPLHILRFNARMSLM